MRPVGFIIRNGPLNGCSTTDTPKNKMLNPLYNL
jgi:hypothetical protein